MSFSAHQTLKYEFCIKFVCAIHEILTLNHVFSILTVPSSVSATASVLTASSTAGRSVVSPESLSASWSTSSSSVAAFSAIFSAFFAATCLSTRRGRISQCFYIMTVNFIAECGPYPYLRLSTSPIAVSIPTAMGSM